MEILNSEVGINFLKIKKPDVSDEAREITENIERKRYKKNTYREIKFLLDKKIEDLNLGKYKNLFIPMDNKRKSFIEVLVKLNFFGNDVLERNASFYEKALSNSTTNK